MAYLLADYNTSNYGTKFFRAISGQSDFSMTSYHGKLTGNDVYCGLLRFESSSGVRYGTLMLSLSPFSQRFTNIYSNQDSSGSSTAVLVTGYTDLYGYLVTDVNEAYPYPDWITDSETFVPLYNNAQDFIDEVYQGALHYPITYHYTNSTVTGPSEEAVGRTVIISAVPDAGYGITNASTQILVTNDNVAIPYTWNAQSNQITFTMPQPLTNRGGFGSTGQ